MKIEIELIGHVHEKPGCFLPNQESATTKNVTHLKCLLKTLRLESHDI